MSQAKTCFHCFQPVPRGVNIEVNIEGETQPMCCYGCQMVAETIVEQGLTHFYKYRQNDPNQALPLVPEELQKFKAHWYDYDEPDIQKEFVKEDGETKTTTLAVEGITCAACAWLIERQLSGLDGLIKVVVNSTTHRIQVSWHKNALKLSDILKTIQAVGYKALPFQEADSEAEYDKQRKSYIRRLSVAGIASMQTMMVAVGLYYDDIDATTRLYFWWVSLLFSAPVFAYSCQPFFQNAWRGLKAKSLNMDVPVSLAIIFAFTASFYATVTDTGQVYYECVTMFAFFLLSGRYLELLARHKAITAAANLMKLIPAIAELKTPEGWQKTIVKSLNVGDVIQVKAGETVPVDGVLISPQAWCHEALLTGESRPIAKQKGDPIYAGSLNQEQTIQLEITHTHQDTLLAGIVYLQDSALGQKPAIVHLADKISKYFVLGTLIVATTTYLAWMYLDPTRAFWIVLSVLVATCPCALSLAAPTAMSGAVSRLNQQGILLKEANALSFLPKVKKICFDKTGTLTEGHFSILQAWFKYPDKQNHLENIAATLESASEHPLSRAFNQYAVLPNQTPPKNIPGSGLEGFVEGTNYRIGSLAFIQAWQPEYEAPFQQANVYLASESEVLAVWQVDDEIRQDAFQAIQDCYQNNFEVAMLTGDSFERAQAVAKQLGITKIYAGLKPEEKLALVQKFQTEKHVMMVGDGINDAPVLAQADVSVTFASGSELAQAGSDVVILNGKFSAIQTLFNTSVRAQSVIKQNFVWAFGYNAVILPLAISGHVGPLWAMLGMSASSLIVIGNSLRLIFK